MEIFLIKLSHCKCLKSLLLHQIRIVNLINSGDGRKLKFNKPVLECGGIKYTLVGSLNKEVCDALS